MNKTGLEERIEEILKLNLKLVKHGLPDTGKIAESKEHLDAILSGLKLVEAELDSKSLFIEGRTNRLNGLVDVLLKYTLLDFSKKIELGEDGDELDAIALGINTLGEELDHYIHQFKDNEAAMTEKTEDLLRINNQLEQFVYIASHDLQEPLRTITNYVALFQEDYKDKLEKNSSKYLDFIAKATMRMQALISDLLDYARVGQDQNIIAVNCNMLMQDVLKDLQASIEQSGARIELNNLPVIKGHYSELKSLFQNLLSNAIKFKKTGEPLMIHVSAETDNDAWTFAVKDNGIGIEEQYQERIFGIFQRLHSRKEYAGTGIGLAHCKKIVETHHGRMWVESEPGKGSTFYFTIPKTLKR